MLLAWARCMDPDYQPSALEESRPCNGPEASGNSVAELRRWKKPVWVPET